MAGRGTIFFACTTSTTCGFPRNWSCSAPVRALSKEIAGEGLVGLTRGFMYAGARRVVASLWQVDDAATAELMKNFYSRMIADGQPAAALRLAQLDLLERRQWSSGFFWAAFTIQGEWR